MMIPTEALCAVEYLTMCILRIWPWRRRILQHLASSQKLNLGVKDFQEMDMDETMASMLLEHYISVIEAALPPGTSSKENASGKDESEAADSSACAATSSSTGVASEAAASSACTATDTTSQDLTNTIKSLVAAVNLLKSEIVELQGKKTTPPKDIHLDYTEELRGTSSSVWSF
eukprot:gnl/TRDRNA2_/TRDRNA2_9301_c0_seq1.p1 gnl/TRDRNA2_/TRDRNA2_9301_c0~~gnl/TRDRNA2_/TRDRNA2_9301_c0_seq1.p1  ORF type:complete len:174 (-),score=39.18 gnl/TRDRNA2_/TRDRNA2_9301_c0_seq1:51-572(-)